MPSANNTLSAEDRATLLKVSRASIEHGLHSGRALAVSAEDYPESLRPLRASFVTLAIAERLRGCIGTLEARMPLVSDVAAHAYGAAFSDPRFPPLRRNEFPRLQIHISVLSPPERLHFHSQEELLAQLRPGVDGLVLRYRRHRGTFLPAVWESLPEPFSFLTHLKGKAGLAPDFWSHEIEVERYTTESFGDD